MTKPRYLPTEDSHGWYVVLDSVTQTNVFASRSQHEPAAQWAADLLNREYAKWMAQRSADRG